MAIPHPERGNANPEDDLSAELREAVDAILHDDPPADWAEETLQSLRQRRHRVAPHRSPRVVKWVALAVAASIVVVILSSRPWLVDDEPPFVRNSGEHLQQQTVLANDNVTQPTLWVYHRAAGQSPEVLGALLDEHARRLLQPSSTAELGALRQELF